MESNTSHTSPSHDIGRSNSQRLREKSGNKSGSQKGHDGLMLQMIDNVREKISAQAMPSYQHHSC